MAAGPIGEQLKTFKTAAWELATGAEVELAAGLASKACLGRHQRELQLQLEVDKTLKAGGFKRVLPIGLQLASVSRIMIPELL